MRVRLSRKFLLIPIILLVAVVAVLGLFYQDMTSDHGDADQAIAELSSAEARLDRDVLRVVSLRTRQYDAVVSTVLDVESQRDHLFDLLAAPSYRANPAIGRLAGRYGEQIAAKVDILEQVKGHAAFLRDEVAYIPFAVSQLAAHGQRATTFQLLDLSQNLMSLRTQPSADLRRRIDTGIARLSAFTDDQELAAVTPHLRAYLTQQERLDRALHDYSAIDSETVLSQLHSEILTQQARDEQRLTLITRLLGAFATLLILGLGLAANLLIRARTVATVTRRYTERLETERDQRRRVAETLAEKVEQLEQTRDELVQSEKMASLGRMVAGFAHEVNTPVGVAVGAASAIEDAVAAIQDLTRSEEVSEEALFAQLATINEAAGLTLTNLRRAASLVQSFKRTSIDQASDALRDYLVSETIGDVVKSLQPMFRHGSIGIVVECPDNLAAHGPAGALWQILTNLLENSYLHGYGEGQAAGTIHISVTEETPGHLRLEFADNGRGMPADTITRIFEPFFTTRRNRGGSGLGLYIVYNLVTNTLRGTITCISAPGQGTTFTIRFPARVEKDATVDPHFGQEGDLS